MLTRIIIPTPAYIFLILQSYNDFIFGFGALATTRQKMCRPRLLHINFYFNA